MSLGIENSTNELVSIIMPAYNSARYISKAIDSVINQSYSNWELIIIDDYSSDSTKNIIDCYSNGHDRIKYIFLQATEGPANARNQGIKKANGAYIAFLDSDDMWLADKLLLQMHFMVKNDILFSFTAYRKISSDEYSMSQQIDAKRSVDYYTMLYQNYIPLSGVILKQEINNLFFEIDLEYAEDYYLWLSILKEVPYTYGLNKDLLRYRIVKGSFSSNIFRCSMGLMRVYRSYERFTILKSAGFFFLHALNSIYKKIHYPLLQQNDSCKA